MRQIFLFYNKIKLTKPFQFDNIITIYFIIYESSFIEGIKMSEEIKELEKEEVSEQPNKNLFWEKTKKLLSYIFIDGLSGMALGLFATLIIGTIICQIGSFFGDTRIAYYIKAIGTMAKALMGAGIGVGLCYKLKKSPLVGVSAGVCGMIGAFASKIIAGTVFDGAMSITTLVSVGEPLGAFIASFVAISVGSLVAGKTKIDIIVTPFVAIFAGATVGLLIGKPIDVIMTAIRSLIETATAQQPILMSILVAVLMGVCLTLPISSAAIGVMVFTPLSSLAAGSAVIGCCCHMVGFAVMSFRENKWGGLFAQGLGTSMLQMPNLVKKPICWLPPIIASAILGPFGVLAGIHSSKVGAGMGTSGLVGVFETFTTMTANGTSLPLTILLVALFCFILPAVLVFVISEIFRKFGLIKEGDLKLDL